MVIDWVALFRFIPAIVVAFLLVDALRRGTIFVLWGPIERAKQPRLFWANYCFMILVGLVFVAMGLVRVVLGW